MGLLTTDNKQSIYIYSKSSDLGNTGFDSLQNTAQSVRCVNIDAEALSDTIWLEIADLLNCQLQHLFVVKTKSAFKFVDPNSYHVADWLDLIRHRPYMLQQPIAIKQTVARQVKDLQELHAFFWIPHRGRKLLSAPKSKAQ